MKKILLTSVCLMSTIVYSQKTSSKLSNTREARPDTLNINSRLDSDAASGTVGLIDRATRSFEVQGPDFWLGTNDGRSQGVKTKATNNPNRAMVHGDDDELILNYGGDFEGGLIAGSKVVLRADNTNQNFIEIKQNYNGVHRSSDGSQRYLQPGDDSYLTDLDQANTMGLCGTSNKNEGGLKLGATGVKLYGQDGTLAVSNNTKEMLKVDAEGRVGIGTSCHKPDAKLSVNGTIYCVDLVAQMPNAAGCFPDYVFSSDYKLKSLTEVEDYIHKNKHLPNIPSAKEVEKDGLNFIDMNTKLLEKVEEITLYLIELKKENEAQKLEMEVLKKQNQVLNQRIETLESK